MTEEMAKAIRAVKGDVRLDTTDAEQAHASQVTDVVTWVLVGIAVVIVLVGAAFTIAFSSFF
jgi:cell division protein FtsX